MSAATDILHRLNEDVDLMERRKEPGEIIRISYGGAFGVRPVVDMQPATHDSLRIGLRDQHGSVHVVIAPVSQCSFMISAIVPKAGEPVEKVILGFAQQNPT
jgi:hypothetical protein